MSNGSESNAVKDNHIEIWKIKQLIKNLSEARGNGTSMITLVVPAGGQISRTSKMLTEELGAAANIKSHVNKLSVQSAITSARERLKLYPKTPPNGLVIFCGTILTPEGKEKMVTIDIEPFKPIFTSVYLCNNRFHTEPLAELLEADAKFGFIIMDGNGTLFATLSGNSREILQKLHVDLPKKHGRGGQSQVRFGRIRDEKRHNYVRKVSELAVQHFITNDKINVTGLLLAGSADFKTELSQSEMLDPRLQCKILKIVDVSYGGENGFNQAIQLCQDLLANVKFVQEKKIIQQFLDEIFIDSGKYCFGVDDTLRALEAGAVEKLIVWEGLEVMRYVLRDPVSLETSVKTPTKGLDNEKDFNSRDLEVVSAMPLVEWLTENYTLFGASLEIVSNKTGEGSQFINGFGGFGGLLRYKVDFTSYESEEEVLDDEE